MINLNDNSFQEKVVKVFNNGEAGKVDNVSIVRVEKAGVNYDKTGDNVPDYRIIFGDSEGVEINQAWWYLAKRENETGDAYKARFEREISRLLHIARAVLGGDFDFPQVANEKEALDVVVKLIKENVAGKKFSVFANYGTKQRPSKYLNLRYFNFIEPGDSKPTRLRVSPQDQLTRIEADSPATLGLTAEGSDSGASEDEWI